ncbi:hypothetical protein HF1_12900 [Mycoplasma haemofelis str. Langford 1]|uniref:Uncharacterized protein n=1 Tax=Mycoplasma haemofelis (strain Langford 1) TaxID=941640 RepID=E8ZJH7_MYCHL|nr:hypothetical protein [Mycoplasma haemofelis]CBY93298.1 hypothetical protein HF1_12900 [Mycoplasma haemofelis str. Langford 1]
MSIALKGAMGVGGIGATVGGGFLAHSVMSKSEPKKTLAKQLTDDGFTLINLDTTRTEESTSGWKKILDSYKTITAKKPELKIGTFSLETKDLEDINKLKNACASVLKLEEGSSEFTKHHSIASKWCVEPISVNSLLSKRGIILLSTEGSENADAWTTIAKDYAANKKANSKEPMDGVDSTEVSGTDYSGNISKIQTACNTRKTKSSHEEEFEKYLEDVQQWCVSKSKL